MRQNLIASVVLHVALIALFVLGMPPSDRTLDLPPSIPIEIVDLGEVTAAARVDKGEPRPQPPRPVVPESKPAPPPPEPADESPPPPPSPKAPEPPKLAQLPPPPRTPEPPKRAPEPPPAPPPPPPEPEPEPAPVPKPEPKKPEPPKEEPKKPEPPKPEPAKPDPPKPEPKKPEPPKEEPKKPAPPKEEPKKPEPPKPEAKKPEPKKPEPKDPLASLLASVDDLKKDLPKQTAPSSPPSGAKVATAGPDKPFRPSGQAIDAIRSQVGKNWNFDPGRRDSGTMVMEIRIEVARDRTVVRAELDDKYLSRYRSDSAFRAAAEAAKRAIMRSSPLDLLPGEFTPETYDQWRTIVFTFDPRDMF
ncbi:hypothetical protein [Azospirillum sp. A39]|uniref:hypothetical protein n=1 Tax=Azospirillum sp. A39 TaxID=3462279 RepID=UPI0040468233